MRGPRGISYLALALLILSLGFVPAQVWAEPGPSLPFLRVDAKNPLEAEILHERPFHSQPTLPSFADRFRGLSFDREGATLRLPRNLELRVAFLYDGDQAPGRTERPIHSHLLFKYSMGYRLLPNLQVGLSGFLYHPRGDDFSYQRRFEDMIMGVGPGIQYDLGRWSFTFKSQMETGGRGGEGVQNWFRVWYAF